MNEHRRAREITAVDIGGTHVRFAPATIDAEDRPVLGNSVVFRTAQFTGLATAWRAYCETLKDPPPDALSVCFAGPIRGDTLQATNSHWTLDRRSLNEDLGLDCIHLMNDFGAMAHGVALLRDSELETVCGPTSGSAAAQADGVTTVIGPGTGLGVAILIHRRGQVTVVETEGGHVDFAPLNEWETAISQYLRERFLRVSVERIVSGPGLNQLMQAIACMEKRPFEPVQDAELWRQALDPENNDDLLRQALQQFCMSYGSVAGDLALANGATRVVLVGDLTQRLADFLRHSQFYQRFCAKGRYQSLMAAIPVELACFDQLGLLGAAGGFAAALDENKNENQ